MSSCNHCAELERQLKEGDEAAEENSKCYRAYIAQQAERVTYLEGVLERIQLAAEGEDQTGTEACIEAWAREARASQARQETYKPGREHIIDKCERIWKSSTNFDAEQREMIRLARLGMASEVTSNAQKEEK